MDQAEAVADFLARGVIEARRDEARKLDALFREATGFAPRLWPGSILGYGAYAYRYDSGRSGISLACGFAPRKAEIVVYTNCESGGLSDLLAGLGPHRAGKSCIYLKRLDRVDPEALVRLIRAGLADLGRRSTVTPG